MAKTKPLTLDQIDEAAKNLTFQEQILHFQNFRIYLEGLEKDLTEEKEEKEDKLLKLKGLK